MTNEFALTLTKKDSNLGGKIFLARYPDMNTFTLNIFINESNLLSKRFSSFYSEKIISAYFGTLGNNRVLQQY